MSTTTSTPQTGGTNEFVEPGGIADILEESAKRRRNAVAAWRKAGAELTVVKAFDDARGLEGHDYGNGQRAKELGRRRREVEALARVAAVYGTDVEDLEPPTNDELLDAYRRLILPRVRRARNDTPRSRTGATHRIARAAIRAASALGIDARRTTV